MKKLIILAAITLMAGIVSANDPNNMPNPTAQNRVTSCVDGNYTHLIIYTPDENQQILAGDVSFPLLVESVLFRYIPRWIKDVFDAINSDLTDNILDAKAAREKRDRERTR